MFSYLLVLFLLAAFTCASLPPTRPIGTCTRPGIDILESAFSTEFANGLQKQVIIYFYKVGCPFCAKFDPTWRCLVDVYANNQNVVFLKYAASESYHIANSYSVETMPTIRYFPKGYRYRAGFLGIDFPTDEALEFDKLSAFIYFALDKSEAQVTYRVPSLNGLHIGKVPRGTSIVSGGQIIYGGTNSFKGGHVSSMYITNTDNTLESCLGEDCVMHGKAIEGEYVNLLLSGKKYNHRWPLCRNYGTCLELLDDYDKNICMPAVLGSTKVIGRASGKHNIFYNCKSVGICSTRWKIRTAPTPIILRWEHQCDGGPSVGLKVGTEKGTMDVVSPNSGREQSAWLTGASKVLPPVDKTIFYMEGSSVIQSSPSINVVEFVGVYPIVNVTVEGDLFRDTWGKLSGDNNPRGYSGSMRKYTNVALKKLNVRLSSMFEGESAKYGNDGMFDLNVVSGKMGKDPEPFYEIDLGLNTYNDFLIKSVRVWNTVDITQQWVIMPFWIMLFSNENSLTDLPRSIQDGLKKSIGSKKFANPTNGKTMYEWVVERNDIHARYVRVQMVETRFLHVTEVEVFALPKDRQCPGGVIGPNGDPECLRLSTRNQIDLTVKYRCHHPGTAQIKAEIPTYPAYSPNKPIQLKWEKECSDLNMDKLDIGLASLSASPTPANPFSDPSKIEQPANPANIMLNGVARKGYEAWPDPYKNMIFPVPPVPPYNASVPREDVPKTMKHVEGHHNVYPLSIKLSQKGMIQKIRKKIKVWALTVIEKNGAAETVPSNRSRWLEVSDVYNIVAVPNIILVKKPNSKDDKSLMDSKNRRRRRRLLEMESMKEIVWKAGNRHQLLDNMRTYRMRASTTTTAIISTSATTTTSAPTDIPSQEVIANTITNHGLSADQVERETSLTPYLDVSGDETLIARLIFGCVRTGDTIVTLNITHTPIWQPYRPTLISMRKTCGGRRSGLHVYPSELVKGKKADMRRPVPPKTMEGGSNAVLENGQPARFNKPGHLPKVGSKQYKIIPGNETTSTFYVRVPVREIDESLGNTTVVKTPCKYDAGSMCRQLPWTNKSTPSITASCDPPICTSSYLGVGNGPIVSGEVVGNTPASSEEEPWTSQGDIVPMKITYGCKEHKNVIVTITFAPSFYDPVSFSYHKICEPSGWRIPSLVLICLTLLLGIGLLVLCIPCPCLKGDSLLKRMKYGKGQYMEV
jgi:thiol-disulfide isomerase/thioredoxin